MIPHEEIVLLLDSLPEAEGHAADAGRLAEIHRELAATGSWQPSFHELSAMAKLAWRHSARCIGRLLWNRLDVLDARAATTADEVFEACVRHLRHSTNGGKIRSTLTAFAPGVRIWNDQLIRYAGYREKTGRILGDPAQAAFTRRCVGLGWEPPANRTAFDVLPLVVQMPGEPPRWYELPRDAVLEVEIFHPEFPWFRDLGLKWHAVPVISNQALAGAGLSFSAAPFSGYYMGTEIASRNFGDESRYNLLPLVAEKMGIDRRQRRLLWKDRALVELNTAVIHSFREAGVTLVDHHTASAQFMQHVENEVCKGRATPGDWSWLVPPMSGSACPVFHRYYDDARPRPAFVEQPRPW